MQNLKIAVLRTGGVMTCELNEESDNLTEQNLTIISE